MSVLQLIIDDSDTQSTHKKQILTRACLLSAHALWIVILALPFGPISFSANRLLSVYTQFINVVVPYVCIAELRPKQNCLYSRDCIYHVIDFSFLARVCQAIVGIKNFKICCKFQNLLLQKANKISNEFKMTLVCPWNRQLIFIQLKLYQAKKAFAVIVYYYQ